MKEWKNPEISNLSFRETKAVPGAGGNDNWISGNDTGGLEAKLQSSMDLQIGETRQEYTKSGVINIWKDYNNTDIRPYLTGNGN